MNICNLDIDHFNLLNLIEKTPLRSLKNLPTTWGLRLHCFDLMACNDSSEKPPHHMGIKTQTCIHLPARKGSEKPPHHMGIKTKAVEATVVSTTGSEKPPHHMGIKTC